jgi:endonuclease/exonuclease/phosphatase family metal-dependent hydrolase
MIKFCFLVFFATYSYSLDFKVATYNVENLFDMYNDGTEYQEYKPNTKYWNKKAFKNKIDNISKVIKAIDADIVSLQEIESKRALQILLKKLPSYKYSYFLKNKNSAIGVAIISRFEIIENRAIVTDIYSKYSRPILKSTILIEGKKLIIYSNHWKSKRSAESTRIPYAQSLYRDIQTLKQDEDYIVLGDLNSNYDEYLTFSNNKRLNDTFGITGINQVLNTTIQGNLIVKKDILKSKNVLYNLWLELDTSNRFSSIFRGDKNTPDNILLPYSLFDNKNISYVNNSFKVFKKPYLYNKNINRWDKKKAKGYSDHLAIYATFSTSKQIYKLKPISKYKKNSINNLYDIQKLNQPIVVKDAIVIYKYKNKAIIKTQNSKAILIYKHNNRLKLSYKYDLKIKQIAVYNGLKEIVDFKILKKNKRYKDYKTLYLDGDHIDMFDRKYQNEIVTNLKGIYKKRYLHFDNKKIYLYFDKQLKQPKNNTKLEILNGHLSIYKSKIQIVLYKQSDFKANNR